LIPLLLQRRFREDLILGTQATANAQIKEVFAEDIAYMADTLIEGTATGAVTIGITAGTLAYIGCGVCGLGYPYYSNYYYPYDYPFAYYDDTPYYGYNDYLPVAAGSSEATVQTALAQRGYYRSAIDGILGPASQRAIRSFQADQRFPVLCNSLGEFFSPWEIVG